MGASLSLGRAGAEAPLPGGGNTARFGSTRACAPCWVSTSRSTTTGGRISTPSTKASALRCLLSLVAPFSSKMRWCPDASNLRERCGLPGRLHDPVEPPDATRPLWLSPTPSSVPASEGNCLDGVDADLDGRVDCEDADCVDSTGCIEVCANGEDDDNNGLVDEEDTACWTHESTDAPRVTSRVHWGGAATLPAARCRSPAQTCRSASSTGTGAATGRARRLGLRDAQVPAAHRVPTSAPGGPPGSSLATCSRRSVSVARRHPRSRPTRGGRSAHGQLTRCPVRWAKSSPKSQRHGGTSAWWSRR